MSFAAPTRRTVVRTAAWSVPAVTLATAAPAFAASEPGVVDYEVITRSFTYNITADSLLGTTPMGPNTINVTVRVPKSTFAAGAPVAATVISSANITLSQAASDGLRGKSINWLEEDPANRPTMPLAYSSGGTDTVTLRVPRYAIPSSGLVIPPVTGAGSGGVTAPTSAGTSTITLGIPHAPLKARVGNIITSNVTLTFEKIAGENYDLHTFTVA